MCPVLNSSLQQDVPSSCMMLYAAITPLFGQRYSSFRKIVTKKTTLDQTLRYSVWCLKKYVLPMDTYCTCTWVGGDQVDNLPLWSAWRVEHAPCSKLLANKAHNQAENVPFPVPIRHASWRWAMQYHCWAWTTTAESEAVFVGIEHHMDLKVTSIEFIYL